MRALILLPRLCYVRAVPFELIPQRRWFVNIYIVVVLDYLSVFSIKKVFIKQLFIRCVTLNEVLIWNAFWKGFHFNEIFLVTFSLD